MSTLIRKFENIEQLKNYLFLMEKGSIAWPVIQMNYFNKFWKRDDMTAIRLNYKNGVFTFYNDFSGATETFMTWIECLKRVQLFLQEKDIKPETGYVDEILQTAMKIHNEFDIHDNKLKDRRANFAKNLKKIP